MKSIQQFENIYGIKISKRKHIEILLFLICAEIVISLSYLGYIQIAPISVTTLHILVIVAAMYFGPWDACAIATVFAITSMWKASFTSTEIGDLIFSPTLSGNPIGSIVMAFGCRIIFAIIAGYLFRWLFSKKRKSTLVWTSLISLITTLIHSLLVYVCMIIFFKANTVETSSSFGNALVLNNLILFAVTIGIVILFYYIPKFKNVNEFLVKVSDEKYHTNTKINWLNIIFFIVLIICFVFIVLHFISRLTVYLREKGTTVNDEYLNWTKALIAQFIVGFLGLFGILCLFVRWFQEYYSTLTIEANIKARENAEIANKSKSTFLFSMSHDIRTPMNAILGYTDIALNHEDDPKKVNDSLNKIKTSSVYLLNLINNVLEVSQIESGNVKVEEKTGDVYLSFTNIEATLTELAATKDITLSFEYGEIKNRYVYCDFTRCMRVFVNIISNSIKYTPDGGKVIARCEQISDEVDGIAYYKYSFIDNGIGMSEEFQAHVYEQFSRENNSTISKVQGTGLGMSVVKSYVDLMNGTIELKSKQGEGSTFIVTLPFKIQKDEKYVNPLTGEVVNKDEYTYIDKNIFKGKKVLVVEDNELNREIACEMLTDEGFNVEEANDGVVAVKLLGEKGPSYYDFVLMDIQMPIMNGYEATKKIREMFPDASLPIIALSANAFEEDRKASLDAGMNDHVSKPINLNDLLVCLLKFIIK